MVHPGTEAGTKQRKSRKRSIALGIFLIVLVAAYTAGWFYVADRLQTRATADMAKLSAQGIGVRCEDLRTSGYPLRVNVVCDSISCFLTGYDEVKASLEKNLGIGMGQTTTDNRFTLLPICCLGACDKGPTMMINDDLHGDLTPQKIAGLLEAYK